MRFARLGEEVFLRSHEIACEEFRLYAYIVFHTFSDSGICRMTIAEICEIYKLEYHNTSRRFKILRKDFTDQELAALPTKTQDKLRTMKTPWVEKTSKGIRPLVGMKSVNFTLSNEPKKSVKITPESVNITLEECKNYTPSDEKSVNITPAFKGIIEPFKEAEFLPASAAEKTAAGGSSKKRAFFRIFKRRNFCEYVEIRQRARRIYRKSARTREAMARIKPTKAANSDLFIQSRILYP